LIALGQPAEALPHLKSALQQNPESEVAYYQMAQAFKALGNTSEQEKALAEFNRVRDLTSQRSGVVPQGRQDVTPQVVDVKSPK
jgi:predicted Zn-dependent protease